jgi:hypothetical protein
MVFRRVVALPLSLLNDFRHPGLPKPMFITLPIQANGIRGALKSALAKLKKIRLN